MENEAVDITRSLQQLVGTHEMLTKCEKCGSKHITYLGLGEFKCEDCRELSYNTYGIVRNCIEGHDEPLTIMDVLNYTGLRKMDIKRLLQEGAIILTKDGIQVPIQ